MTIKIYYINLDRRTDRNLLIQDSLKFFEKYNIQCERISAIDGTTLDLDSLIKTNVISPQTTLKKGEIACSLSHIKAWETFLESKNYYGIFLEDDVCINCNYANDIFEEIIKELDSIKFDWLFLSFNSLGNLKTYDGKIIEKHFYIPDTYGYGTHAYILNRKGALKILKYYKNKNIQITHQLDLFSIVEHDITKIINSKFIYMSVLPDFKYYNTFEESKYIYINGKEFLIYAKDFSDSDTSKII